MPVKRLPPCFSDEFCDAFIMEDILAYYLECSEGCFAEPDTDIKADLSVFIDYGNNHIALDHGTKAIPHNCARRFDKESFITNLLRKCRNTLCISNFSQRICGEKVRQSPQAQLCGVVLSEIQLCGVK